MSKLDQLLAEEGEGAWPVRPAAARGRQPLVLVLDAEQEAMLAEALDQYTSNLGEAVEGEDPRVLRECGIRPERLPLADAILDVLNGRQMALAEVPRC